MASLTGNLVAETYKALLKTIDNDILTASEKQITDGFGGGSNVFIDSNGFLRANKYKVTNGLATQFLKADGSLDANTYLTSITSSQIITALGYTPVTNARTLTINGTTYDLSANRSWTIAGTAAVWGNISGTLSDQTDLQTALNAKFNNPTGTISQYIRGDGTLATFPAITGFVPYTGATQDVDLGTHTLLARDLVIDHASASGTAVDITKGGSGIAVNIEKSGSGEALTVVKSSGSGNAASITGGTTLISELHLTTKLADAYILSAATWNAKQNALNGTGFVKASGTTISYDNSTYLTTADAASTYQRLDRMAINLLASDIQYPNNNAVIAALALKANAANPVFTGNMTISGAEPKLFFTDTDNNPDYTVFIDSGVFFIYDQTAGATRFSISSTGNISAGVGKSITAGSFVKESGTAAQFLKADGSIDSSTYVSSAALADYLLITTATSTYQRLDRIASSLFASATNYPNNNAVIAGLALKADAANPVFTGSMNIQGLESRINFYDENNLRKFFIGYSSGQLSIYQDAGSATRFVINSSGNISTGVGNTITSSGFIKDGGTSSQYLMADGSISTGVVTGTGTTNYLPKWTSGSGLGNSILTESASGIGIGIASANGLLQFSNAINSRKIVLYEGANNDFQFYGFGINSGQLVYSVYSGTDDHVFYSGASATARTELTRIKGNGTLIVKNSSSIAGLSATVYAIGEFMSTGSVSGYFWENRSGGVTSNSNWYGWYTTAGLIKLYNGSSNLLSISGTSGNMSIGSDTDSGYKLDVNGYGRFSNQLLLGNFNGEALKFQSSTSTGSTYQRFYNSAGTARGYLGLFWSGSSDYMVYDSGSLEMNLNSSNKFTFSGGGTAIFNAQINLNQDNIWIRNPSNTIYRGIVLGATVADGTEYAYIKYQPNSGQLILFGSPSGFGGNTIFQNNGSTWLSVNASNALSFTGAATFSGSVTAVGNISTSAGSGFIVGGTAYPFNPSSTRGSLHIAGSTDRLISFGTNGNQDLYIYNASSISQIVSTPDLALVSGGSERMRITSGGNVLIGTTTDAGAKFRVHYDGGNGSGGLSSYNILATTNSTSSTYQATIGAIHPGDGYGNLNLGGNGVFWHISKRLSSDAHQLEFYYNNGSSFVSRFIFSTVGNLTATAFFESSDMRLKRLIDGSAQIAGIENLEAKLYEKEGKTEFGYFAQDAQKYMPYSVSKNTDGFLTLSYREVHTAKIARLEQRVAELEKQLNLN